MGLVIDAACFSLPGRSCAPMVWTDFERLQAGVASVQAIEGARLLIADAEANTLRGRVLCQLATEAGMPVSVCMDIRLSLERAALADARAVLVSRRRLSVPSERLFSGWHECGEAGIVLVRGRPRRLHAAKEVAWTAWYKPSPRAPRGAFEAWARGAFAFVNALQVLRQCPDEIKRAR